MNFYTGIQADVTEERKFYDSLEGKSEKVLRNLHAGALVAESDAKRELTVLRQRAANQAADTDTAPEKEVITAKEKLAESLAWLKAIEARLEGTLKDHNTGAKFGDE